MIDFDIFKISQVLIKTKKSRSFYMESRHYKNFHLIKNIHCLSTWFILLFNKLLNKKTYIWSHCWHGDEKGARALITKLYLNLAMGLLLYGNYSKYQAIFSIMIIFYHCQKK